MSGKEKNLHAIVLVNAIWKAAQELHLDEVIKICEKTCWNIKEFGVYRSHEKSEHVKITCEHISDAATWSDEADAKQVDDAQRYRDWKNER